MDLLKAEYRGRMLHPVVKQMWGSGSDFVIPGVGSAISYRVGGFFGELKECRAVRVEIDPACNGDRPLPVIIGVDEAGTEVRLAYGAPMRCPGGRVTGWPHDGWVDSRDVNS